MEMDHEMSTRPTSQQKRVALDEALKRLRSHARVVGAGIFNARGTLAASTGEFDAKAARRCARAVAVVSRALCDGSDDDAPDGATAGDQYVECSPTTTVARARRGSRDVVIVRCGHLVVAVATCTETPPPLSL